MSAAPLRSRGRAAPVATCGSARLRKVATAVLAAIVLAGGGWGDPWSERLAHLPASTVDPALPQQKFGLWLSENLIAHLPRDAMRGSRFQPCGTDRPGCMILDGDIASRARRLVLRFDRETFRFIGGSIGGPELELAPPIESLAELPARLSEAQRPYPLDCREGTTLRLEEEHAGLREWCEDAAGVKQGPARAWFSTGRYLMYRGAYRGGERNGPWFECDRFERCGHKRYIDGRAVPSQRGG
jgi:hypothetical protein